MKKYLPFIIIALLFTACTSTERKQEAKPFAKEGYYPVTKVSDGDTFWIDDGTDKGKKIRLIGVDAPESAKSEHKDIGYYGKEAKEYLQQYLAGKSVRLEYDVEQYDKYHRTLAYVYMEDGTFLNAELVKQGYAKQLTVPPNVKYAGEFRKLQAEAREKGKGLWGREN